MNRAELGLQNGEWGLVARSLLGNYYVAQIISGPWVNYYAFVALLGSDQGYRNIGYVVKPNGVNFPYLQPVEPDH